MRNLVPWLWPLRASKSTSTFPCSSAAKECRERETLEHRRFGVPVVFLPAFGLHLGLDIERVEQFGPGLVFEIGKAPIGLRIKLAGPDPLPYRREPIAVPGIDAGGIERDQHLLLFAIDHHHEAAVAAVAAMDCLTEAHLSGRVFFAGFLVGPAVLP